MDTTLLAVIRRENLDSFWSRTTDIVNKHTAKLKAGLQISESLGLPGPYYQSCPLPPFDHCGYEVAIHMLMNSLNPGRINKNYMQWDTIRKLRTCYSNYVRASNQANLSTLAINDNKGTYQRIGQDACGSFWFSRFLEGYQNRMGQETKRNKALSIDLLLRVLKKAQIKQDQAKSVKLVHRWMSFLCYAAVSYVISLRGNEGFLFELDSLWRHYSDVSQKYFVLTLVGKFKGEANDNAHLIPCVNVTSSRIQVRNIVHKLLEEKRKLDIVHGPAISDHKGKILKSKDINDMFLLLLEERFDENQLHFPPDVRAEVSSCEEPIEALSMHYAC